MPRMHADTAVFYLRPSACICGPIKLVYGNLLLQKLLKTGACWILAGLLPAIAQTLYRDDFRHGLDRWVVELEKGGRVEARDGVLSIDVPAGCTIWFRPELSGAVEIRYEARMVRAGAKNDRVSDLNAFWMATDARSADFFEVPRSGRFADYNQLRAYYVVQGGNSNTTTRFRRYVGDPELRPLLPQHDLKTPLLEPNVWQEVRLAAKG